MLWSELYIDSSIILFFIYLLVYLFTSFAVNFGLNKTQNFFFYG